MNGDGSKGRAHQKQSRKQLAAQKEKWIASVEKYYGKLALLKTYEQMGIEDGETARLRTEIRRQRVLLENKGAI